MSNLKLSKEIYTKESIDNAISAYKQLAKIACVEFPNYYLLHFKDCCYDQSLTMREYENYVIDLIASKYDK